MGRLIIVREWDGTKAKRPRSCGILLPKHLGLVGSHQGKPLRLAIHGCWRLSASLRGGIRCEGLDDPKHLAASGIAIEIHAGAIPVVVEMAALDGIGRQVGVEETGAYPAIAAHTGVDEPV